MDKITNILLDFLKIISSNFISFLGAVITTSSFFIFIIFLGISFFVTNNYIDILGFVIIPGGFVFGLVLIPLGFFLFRKKIGFDDIKEISPSKFMEKLQITKPKGMIAVLLALTLLNLVVLVVAGYESFHYMESNTFCGTLCHKVMSPEHIAYQDSPHSRVACVDCHIGSGAGPFVKSKIAGTRQLIQIILGSYHKPIQTPLHNLRPARDICEKCHWPEKFHGSRTRNIINYSDDEKNTPSQTVLLVNVGHGLMQGEGIHKHVADGFNVRYISKNDERKKILWVELKRADGSKKEWVRGDYKPTAEEKSNARTMDCIDCHNRATHTYDTLKDALRRSLTHKRIDPSLPFIKREATKALKTQLTDKEKAKKSIQNSIYNFYKKNYPDIHKDKKDLIEKSANEITKLYERNIHPAMQITWGSYPNHVGHPESLDEFPGCFRCHNYELASKEGNSISQDCEQCHSIIRMGEADIKTKADLLKD